MVNAPSKKLGRFVVSPEPTLTPVALTFRFTGTLPQIFLTAGQSVLNLQKQFRSESEMLRNLLEKIPDGLDVKILGRRSTAVEVTVAAHICRLLGHFPWMTYDDILAYFLCPGIDRRGKSDATRAIARDYIFNAAGYQYECFPINQWIRSPFNRQSEMDAYNADELSKWKRPYRMKVVEVYERHHWTRGIHSNANIRCVVCKNCVRNIPKEWANDSCGYGEASSLVGFCKQCAAIAVRVMREFDPTATSHEFWKNAPIQTRAILMDIIVARRVQHACDDAVKKEKERKSYEKRIGRRVTKVTKSLLSGRNTLTIECD